MDYFKKYLKYKKKYMILKSLTQKGSGDHEESEEKYDVCKSLLGITQSIGTCWFDSVMMALLIPSNMNKLWAPSLKTLGLTWRELVDDHDFEIRKAWLENHGRIFSYFPDRVDSGGRQEDLLEYLINRLNINKGVNLEYNYKGKLIKNNIINITHYTEHIIPDDIIFNTSPDFFACLFNSYEFPRMTTMNIKKEIVQNGNTYLLESILLASYPHAVSYVECKGRWYFYDNERARVNKKLLQIEYEIKEGNYYEFNEIISNGISWSPNRLHDNVHEDHRKFNTYIYLYVKKSD